jgi:hypothetical protein
MVKARFSISVESLTVSQKPPKHPGPRHKINKLHNNNRCNRGFLRFQQSSSPPRAVSGILIRLSAAAVAPAGPHRRICKLWLTLFPATQYSDIVLLKMSYSRVCPARESRKMVTDHRIGDQVQRSPPNCKRLQGAADARQRPESYPSKTG